VSTRVLASRCNLNPLVRWSSLCLTNGGQQRIKGKPPPSGFIVVSTRREDVRRTASSCGMSPTRCQECPAVMMTIDEERWAEALMIERIHGGNAVDWVVSRIVALASCGDEAGVARFMEIIDRLDILWARGTPH
jgi:hypothetical protein